MISNVKINDIPNKVDGISTFERNGKTLLVDPETASWLIIDKSAEPLYNKCDGKLTMQDLSVEFGIEPSALSHWVLNAYKSGMISINGNRRINSEKFKTFTDRYPTLGILHTSNKCNLRCKYCYAHPDTAPKKDMSIEVMKKAIDEMLSLPRQHPIVSIEFHGGEPLAHYKAIHEALDYGKKASEAKGISILFQIQSNGTIMNEEIMDFLMEHNVKLRISLDGDKELHDENRLFHNGIGSFDTVFNNIKVLQDRGIPFEVVAVVCQTNIDRLPRVVDFFLENNINAMRLIPMWVQGNADKTLAMSSEVFEKKYVELIRKIIDYNMNNYVKISNLNLKYMLQTVLSWERNLMCFRSPCGAGLDMIDFSVEGDIYPCEEMNEREGLKIGNIFEMSLKEIIDNSELVKTLKSRTTDTIEKCKTCTWKRFCNGGCANKVHVNYDTFFHESESCDFFNKIYLDLIWTVSEIPGASEAILNA